MRPAALTSPSTRPIFSDCLGDDLGWRIGLREVGLDEVASDSPSGRHVPHNLGATLVLRPTIAIACGLAVGGQTGDGLAEPLRSSGHDKAHAFKGNVQRFLPKLQLVIARSGRTVAASAAGDDRPARRRSRSKTVDAWPF